MSYLFEFVARKDIINQKLSEIKNIIQYEQHDKLADELISLIDEKQAILLDINSANTLSKINIGGNEISIAAALIIRKTIKNKIDVLTELITNKNCELDKIELQSQRDNYFMEYMLLTMGINRNDLSVEIDK